MKLYFQGHDYKYAAEQMLLTLFPGERPVYPDGPPEAGEDFVRLNLSEGAWWATATAYLRYQGREYRAARRADVAKLTGELTRGGTLQRILKRAFYDAGTAALGCEPPWGAMTGVRPVKIPVKAMLAGAAPAQAEKILRDDSRVSPTLRLMSMDYAAASSAAPKSAVVAPST